jgi:UDP:flavonoid glycosyltransferase YjiC (YdhE family)
MKITILTYGSSGDVIPYISLTLGLMERGYEVKLAAPQNFETLIKNYGINYCRLFGDIDQLLQSDGGKAMFATGNVKLITSKMATLRYSMRHELNNDLFTASVGSDIIIVGTLTLLYTATISEKLQIPILVANVNPVSVSTKKFPHFFVAAKALPFGFLNHLTFNLFFNAQEKAYADDLLEWRNSLGLAAVKTSVYRQIRKLKVPVLFGYSPVILSKPTDWDSTITVSGVWKLDEKYKHSELPSAELADWLKAGSAPVYFGFGSMPVLNPQEISVMVSEICQELGLRAVINAGWSRFEGKENSSADPVYFIKHTNLEWLFPQCAIIVHHGGVGTTHISIEAGVPTIICSIFADNPLWGERLERLKIGKHIKYKDLSKKKLVKAITKLNNVETKNRAMQIAGRIKAEDGLKNALDFIGENLKNATIYNEDI